MTALSRFISKLYEHGMPFYKLLQKVDGFQWDDQAAMDFIETKQYLRSTNTGSIKARRHVAIIRCSYRHSCRHSYHR
jgi:hypothetical protein